jgi:hypothetical protein
MSVVLQLSLGRILKFDGHFVCILEWGGGVLNQAVEYPHRRFQILLRSTMGPIDVYLVSRFEGKFEEMNTNDAAVDTTSSAMAMSRQHETTPMMQELGRSLSELGPLGNHETSSSPEATGPQNDPACGIMKITPVEVAVSACFICPIFFISLCTLLPCKCFRRYMASLNLLYLSPSFGLS